MDAHSRGPQCRYGDKFAVYLLPDDQDEEAQEDGKQKILLQVCSRASAAQGQLQGQLHRVLSLETMSCLELTKFETMGRCNNPSQFSVRFWIGHKRVGSWESRVCLTASDFEA